MALPKLVWWGGSIWMGGAALIILLYAIGIMDLERQPSWRVRLRRLAVHLPIAAPLLLLFWPVIVVVMCVMFPRILSDQALEQVCSDRWAPSATGPVTEAEWLSGTNAVRLLHGLSVSVSERQRRLFAVACCRRAQDRITDPRSKLALDLAERYADGQASARELVEAAEGAAAAAALALATGNLAVGAAAKACHDASRARVDALAAAERAALSHFRRRRAMRQEQAQFLRDIVGNPFRPLLPRRFPAHVLALAEACAGGDVAMYSVLGDALEELGEPEAAAHCREPRHIKGCHLLDWVLTRECAKT